MSNRKLGLLAAISIVVANMIGTGVFTSLGFQLIDLSDYRAILLLWIIGGILALFGSFCYAELSSSFPKSGGEYHFLNLSMGRTVGFLSGWTSAVLGFAAPIAAAAHAFATYFSHVIPFDIHPLILSTVVILLISVIHSVSLETGARFQILFTLGKIILLIGFIGTGLYLSLMPPEAAGSGYLLTGDLYKEINQSGFWVGLIFVSYAYSGWNASAYMIDEIRNPVRFVPRSIILGTILVMVLYTTLNFTFLVSAPAEELVGKEDVAFGAANRLFGNNAAVILSSLIAFFLISTISSMIMVGPRVIYRIAEDNPELKFLSQQSSHATPLRAIWLQTLIALVLLHTSGFQFIVTAIGFVLALFTTLTAASTLILRKKYPDQPRPVRIPFYPIPPLVYIIFNIWIMIYVAKEKTMEVLFGISFLLIGLLFLRFALHKKILKPFTGFWIVSIFLIACESKPSGSPEQAADKKGVQEQPAIEPFTPNAMVDKHATILAGGDSAALSDADWRVVKGLNRDWTIHDTSILQRIQNWSIQEKYGSARDNGGFVFYPFSGPDIPFAKSFYPEANTFVLVGLEKAGSTKSLMLQPQPDYGVFLKNAQRYFYFSSRYGYFRTLDMEKQFLERGVVDILAYYLKKQNCQLGDVYIGNWDPVRGDTVRKISDTPDFCHLRFQDANGKTGDVVYFSKDLSDEGLSKDSAWLTWVQKIQGARELHSMTKSASYLMDRSGFSIIRDFLVKKADLHIQDDSGIGYDYLKKSGRAYRLYGTYTRTIPLFAERFRPELAAAYRNDSVPRLPFQIGYTAAYGEGNLQVMKR